MAGPKKGQIKPADGSDVFNFGLYEAFDYQSQLLTQAPMPEFLAQFSDPSWSVPRGV